MSEHLRRGIELRPCLAGALRACKGGCGSRAAEGVQWQVSSESMSRARSSQAAMVKPPNAPLEWKARMKRELCMIIGNGTAVIRGTW